MEKVISVFRQFPQSVIYQSRQTTNVISFLFFRADGTSHSMWIQFTGRGLTWNVESHNLKKKKQESKVQSVVCWLTIGVFKRSYIIIDIPGAKTRTINLGYVARENLILLLAYNLGTDPDIAYNSGHYRRHLNGVSLVDDNDLLFRLAHPHL